MKNLLFALICCLISIAPNQLKSQIRLSTETTTINYDFSGYTSLDISDDFKVTLTQSEGEESIELEVNENLQDYVSIEQDGRTLRIGLKGYRNLRGRLVLNLNIVTSNAINEFRVRSDAQLMLKTPLDVKDLSIRLSSDAKFAAKVEAENLDFTASSDAVAELEGTIGKANMELASDAILNARNLKVDNLRIHLASDARAELTVNEKLNATASSDAILRYRGDPGNTNVRVRSDAEVVRL